MKLLKRMFVVLLGAALLFGFFLVNLFYDISQKKISWRTLNERQEYKQVINESDSFSSRIDSRFYSVFDIPILNLEMARLDFLIAEAAFLSKDKKKARKHYGRIINLDHPRARKLISRAYYNRSIVSLSEEKVRIGEVKGDLEKSLEIDPNHKNAKHNLELINIMISKMSKKKGQPKSGDQGFEMGDILKDLWKDGDSKKTEKEKKQW